MEKDGEMSGTSGQAKRLEAIRISLYGEMAEHYDIYYRVHAQSFGWLSWAKTEKHPELPDWQKTGRYTNHIGSKGISGTRKNIR